MKGSLKTYLLRFSAIREQRSQLNIQSNPYYPPEISFENHETCAISKEHFSVT